MCVCGVCPAAPSHCEVFSGRSIGPEQQWHPVGVATPDPAGCMACSHLGGHSSSSKWVERCEGVDGMGYLWVDHHRAYVSLGASPPRLPLAPDWGARCHRLSVSFPPNTMSKTALFCSRAACGNGVCEPSETTTCTKDCPSRPQTGGGSLFSCNPGAMSVCSGHGSCVKTVISGVE